MVRSTKKLVGLGAMTAVAALVLAGCATDGGDDDTTPDETEAPAADACPPEGEGEVGAELDLKIGTSLPTSGNLAFLGPPEIAAVDLAESLINDYAETTGLSLEIVHGDSGDTDNRAYETEIPRVLGEDVSAIIGAASSGVSLQFIDEVVGACVIQLSPANTSPEFTDYPDNGLYFRTAPSDVLQGDVLGNMIAADGNQTLGMIVINDSYGTGLAQYTRETFEAAGGTVVAETTYNTGDTTFNSQISEVLAEDPDAIALITFEEVTTMIPNIVSDYPAENLYFVDGNLSNFGDEFPEGTLEGAKGTFPGTSVDMLGQFRDDLDAFLDETGGDALNDYTYAGESFDAVNLIALGALATGSTDAATIASVLQEISGGSGDGETCTSFAECADIILDGGTIDYDGVSSPITFDENGDPQEAVIGEYIFGPDNTYSAVE